MTRCTGHAFYVCGFQKQGVKVEVAACCPQVSREVWSYVSEILAQRISNFGLFAICVPFRKKVAGDFFFVRLFITSLRSFQTDLLLFLALVKRVS